MTKPNQSTPPMTHISELIPDALHANAKRSFAALLMHTESWTGKADAATLYAEIRTEIPDNGQFHRFCADSAAINLAPTPQSAQGWVRAEQERPTDTILDSE